MAVLEHLGRGPKAQINEAITSGLLKAGDFVVTTDGEELVVIERDNSLVVIKSRTQEEILVSDPALGVAKIAAGTSLDEIVALFAARKNMDVAASTVEGNVKVTNPDQTTKDVPVVGALIDPVVNEAAHTLTLTKVGLTENSEIVVPLGGASPDTMISDVQTGVQDLTFKVTKFDKASETSTTETVKIFGAVTALDTQVAGAVDTLAQNAAGETVRTRYALSGSVINAAYDADTKVLTLPVVTEVAEDGTITTQDVVIDFKKNVAGAIVDVTATADTETESAKYTYKYYDVNGVEQTKVVYETGVRKVALGSTADKVAVTTADTTGALTTTEFVIGAGNVKNPTYDAETRKITLPVLQADGTTQALEINLGKDMVVKSGVYNEDTQEIELTLTDDSVVKIPAAALVDVYTGGTTDTALVKVSEDNVITALVKVDPTMRHNVLNFNLGGLYVSEDDFTETKQAIADAEAAAKKHADDAMAQEVIDRNAAIAAEAAARATAISDSETAVKAYADAAVAAAKPVWVDFGA